VTELDTNAAIQAGVGLFVPVGSRVGVSWGPLRLEFGYGIFILDGACGEEALFPKVAAGRWSEWHGRE